jgi:hypothetical protein
VNGSSINRKREKVKKQKITKQSFSELMTLTETGQVCENPYLPYFNKKYYI